MVLIFCCLVTACDKSDKVTDSSSELKSTELLTGLFSKPVATTDDFLYPEVTDLKGLEEASQRIFMPADKFFSAYTAIQNTRLEPYKQHIKRLNYKLAEGEQYEAYAYADAESETKRIAYLFIPGSGINEAGKIFYEDDEDYHCCLRQTLDSDVYVYVKPNNDFLAIHSEGKILNAKVALYSQLLVMGGSYSTRYLVDAIALTKHLKTIYEKVVVVGLSQGGNAALLVALQAEPDAAVVASGFSVMNNGPVYVAGSNQIIIPGFLSVYTPEYIAETIKNQSTRYLFTYGKSESGVYRYETVAKVTEEFFSNTEQMEFSYHPDGHVFPVDVIKTFLSKQGL